MKWKKQGPITYNTDRENKVSKMFIATLGIDHTLKRHFSYDLLKRCSILLARFFILEAELSSSDKKIIPLSEGS